MLFRSTKEILGIPDEPFHAPNDLVSEYRERARGRCKAAHADWSMSAAPRRLSEFCSDDAGALKDCLPTFGDGDSPATRVAVQKVISQAIDVLPNLVAGAADLTGNTGARLGSEAPFSREERAGRQIYFGVREHAMGAIANGMALHGCLLPVVGTFFVFADYMRPAIRLAALSGARVVFVFSHDSVGVGEDGPTHQPVEHLASLRVIPGLAVYRPADGNETARAFLAAASHNGPSALILSRQNLPTLTDGSAVARGAATIVASDDPSAILMATGSEVALCVEVARNLADGGISVNVVSAPCLEEFARQDEAYRSRVLPKGVPVVSVEAGSTLGWSSYADASVGIDTFGTSAPGSVALEHLGISVANVTAAVRSVVGAR